MRPAYHGRTHSPDGTDPIPGISGDSPRIVRGAVDNDANIIAGTGFTVGFAGPNVFTITFTIPFANPPIVALTANNNNPTGIVGEYGVSLTAGGRLAGSIEVVTVDFDGTATDAGFDFVAMEAAT